MTHLASKLNADKLIAMSSAVRIENQQTSEFSPWVMTEIQKQVVRDVCEHQNNLILKARQEGVSTVCAWLDAWAMISFEKIKVGLVADKLSNAKNILDKVRSFLTQLGCKFTKSSEFGIELSNGSSMTIITVRSPTNTAESASAGRSHTFHWAHFTELDFYEDHRAFGTITTGMSLNATIIVESTAASSCGQLKRMWETAEGFHRRFFSVEAHPNYRLPKDMIPDNKWLEFAQYGFTRRTYAAFVWQKCQSKFLGDVITCLREYPPKPDMAFAASGDRWIAKDPILSPFEMVQGLKVFREYNPRHQYLVACDVASGKARDGSTCVVMDRVTQKIAAYIKDNRMNEDELCHLAERARLLYHAPEFIVEENAIGRAVLMLGKERGYPVRGVITTTARKHTGLLLAKQHIEDGDVGDLDLQEEVASIRRDGDKFRGKKDLLMTIGICKIEMGLTPMKPEKVYSAEQFNPDRFGIRME